MNLLMGIGGPSCSGKSTLTNWLAHLLYPLVTIIHQDSFYKSDNEIPSNNGILDWDCPESIDFDAFILHLKIVKDSCNLVLDSHIGANRPETRFVLELDMDLVLDLASRIKTILETSDKKIFFIDGFLLFCDKAVQDLMDVSFFLEASFDTLSTRRGERSAYITLEGSWADPPEYFKDVVWPNYLKWNKSVLDGSETKVFKINTDVYSVEQMLLMALEKLLAHLQKTL